MDMSSGDVAFGCTCPGTLMQDLLRDKADQVRKITKFQTSFNLGIVHRFITSIDKLEDLSVLNYKFDGSALWPAVFHHAKSLRSLAIHTPPHVYIFEFKYKTWTPSTVRALASRLPNLRHLEMDIPLAEAESVLAKFQSTSSAPGIQPGGPDESQFVTDILAATLKKMPDLNSLLLNIRLANEASSLCAETTTSIYGGNTFPEPDAEVCQLLAQTLLDKLHPGFDETGKERHLNLQVRLVRRWWSDRAQFYTYGYLIPLTLEKDGDKHAGRDDEVTKMAGGSENKPPLEEWGFWGEYLPPWPQGLLSDLMWKWSRENPESY
ncbi:hypothetical protein V8F20_008305 [Naviculisporaceae sp. PSN 640]